MVNSNPETVSTDYDTSDKLYFEPLTREDVLHIVETEQPTGVIVQFGGQTPLNLATALLEAGVHIMGTHPHSIDRAEDREQFQAMLKKLGLVQPGKRHGQKRGGGRPGSERHWLSGDRASFLRIGGAGHENRVQPGSPGEFYPFGHRKPPPNILS